MLHYTYILRIALTYHNWIFYRILIFFFNLDKAETTKRLSRLEAVHFLLCYFITKYALLVVIYATLREITPLISYFSH